MANTVYTAPLAIVMVGTTVIGKMKNIRVSETIRRARVTGLGRLNASEVPAVEFTGTLNASFYTVNLEAHELTRRALNRKTGTTTNFVNTVVLQDIGLTIKLMRKVGDPAYPATTTTDLGQDNTTGIIYAVDQEFATITNCYITSDNFDVNEGTISSHDSTFEYLDPITFSV
jgi:hypothetical protein